jgi:hypothetical protein
MFCLLCGAFINLGRYKSRTGWCSSCDAKYIKNQSSGTGKGRLLKKGSFEVKKPLCVTRAQEKRREKIFIALKKQGLNPRDYAFILDVARSLGFLDSRNNEFEKKTKKYWEKVWYLTKEGKRRYLFLIPKRVLPVVKRMFKGLER